jgi:hypothetical protein
MEEIMGAELPSTDEINEDGIPQEIEVRVSQLAAQAAQQLLGQNQAEEKAKQNAQAAQDPLIQMQMQELQIKQQDLQLKQQKLQIDAAAKADQIRVEESRIESQKEIAGMQVGAKIAKDKADLEAKMELEGLKIGTDIAHKRAQLNVPKGTQKKGD